MVSFDDTEQGGEIFVSESQCNLEQEFYYEILLDSGVKDFETRGLHLSYIPMFLHVLKRFG